jgi:hypothetical protein
VLHHSKLSKGLNYVSASPGVVGERRWLWQQQQTITKTQKKWLFSPHSGVKLFSSVVRHLFFEFVPSSAITKTHVVHHSIPVNSTLSRHHNLMQSGGPLGNVSQKLKYFGLLVHFQEYNL